MDYTCAQSHAEPEVLFQHSNSFRCSSYIDSRKQYEFNESTGTKPKPIARRIGTNVKKMRQAITKKLKKLINLNESTATATPISDLKFNQTATLRRSAFKSRTSLVLTRSASSKRVNNNNNNNSIVQLTNYKYNGSSNYDLTMVASTTTPRRCPLPRRLTYRRHSDGLLSSSSSSSSLASSHSSQDTEENFRSAQITHLFTSCTSQCAKVAASYHREQQQASSFASSQVQTSTPVQHKVRRIDIDKHIESYTRDCQEPSFSAPRVSGEDLIIVGTKTSGGDGLGVVAPPPPPVPSHTSIVESHELVKRAIQQTMSESTKNWNLLVINKYHDDTNATFGRLPEWAVGNELNVAVVNQLYYNRSASGVFSKNKRV